MILAFKRVMAVIGSSTRAGTDANELDLRQFFHGVFDAFASDTALLDAAERIHVETKAARLVDPQRSHLHVIGKAHGMGETPDKYRPLQTEIGIIGQFDRLINA